MKKAILPLIISLLLTLTTVLSVFAVPYEAPTTLSAEEAEPTVLTLSELGKATIAGTGAYYDDGMLKYDNSGNTVGYVFDQRSAVVEFDLIFDYLVHPAWFSMTFKANGFDRTQSANLSQKGYSFVIFANGTVQVWADGIGSVSSTVSNFTPNERHRIRVGAYDRSEGVVLYLSIDGEEVINQVDTNARILGSENGNWFNICGDGGTSARLFSTKSELIPDYYTYTLSTLEDYPCIPTGNDAYADSFNNITLGSGTVGFYQALRSYSLEANFNWSEFSPGSNVWVAMRVGGFDRANSPNLGEHKGYSFRIGQLGAIEIYKNGVPAVTGGWSFVPNTDYHFEFGTVDINPSKTFVFININGVPAASFIDDSNPIQESGWFNMNGDGSLKCRITSANTKLTPLKTTVKESEDFVITTYFHNTVSHTDMSHGDFDSILQDAIIINGYSVSELNRLYYSLSEGQSTNAVTLSYVENRLTVQAAKTLYKKSNNEMTAFSFEQLQLKKTGTDSGMICPGGYVLKQTYYFNYTPN